LGRPLYGKIPRDDKAIERVQLKGQDLWQVSPNSPLAKAVEDLATRLASAGGYTQTEQTNGGGAKFLSRLREAFGGARA
jgi:hypothetical protein